MFLFTPKSKQLAQRRPVASGQGDSEHWTQGITDWCLRGGFSLPEVLAWLPIFDKPPFVTYNPERDMGVKL